MTDRGGDSTPWKAHGTYLITGGMGGLGAIFGEEIVRGCRNLTLILVGRSRLNSDALTRLEIWRGLGAEVHYRQVDIGRKDHVDTLIDEIKRDHGKIDGTHRAGVNRGRYILEKSAAEFRRPVAKSRRGCLSGWRDS